MTPYRFSERALADFEAIVGHIADDNPGAAERLAARVFQTLSLLCKSPGIGHARRELGDQSLRVFRVHPYLIVYRGAEARIDVVAFVHGAREIGELFAEK